MDYIRMRAILLKEYIRSGGQNANDFLRGMAWLEEMISEQESHKEERLNESVPEQQRIQYLQKELDKANERTEQLEKELKHKKNIIKNFRRMTTKERSELRKEKAFKDMEAKYSNIWNDYVMHKDLISNKNP